VVWVVDFRDQRPSKEIWRELSSHLCPAPELKNVKKRYEGHGVWVQGCGVLRKASAKMMIF